MAADRPSRRVCMDSSRTRRVLRTELLEDELEEEEKEEEEEEEEEEMFLMQAEAVEELYCLLKLLAARFSDW